MAGRSRKARTAARCSSDRWRSARATCSRSWTVATSGSARFAARSRLTMRRVSGGLAPIDRAIPSARGSGASGSTTSSTRPILTASAASTRSPEGMSRAARPARRGPGAAGWRRARGRSRGSRTAARSGPTTTPRRRRRRATSSRRPRPPRRSPRRRSACPRRGGAASRSPAAARTRHRAGVAGPRGPGAPRSGRRRCRSPRPALVSTTAPTASSAFARPSASTCSAPIWGVQALSFSGLPSVSTRHDRRPRR